MSASRGHPGGLTASTSASTAASTAAPRPTPPTADIGPDEQQLPPMSPQWRAAVLGLPWVAATGCVLAAAAATSAAGGGAAGLADAARGAGLSAGPLAAPVLGMSLLVGLPHGAVDLLRPETGATGSRARRAAAGGLYALAAAASFGAWMLVPLPVLLVLLVLAVVHFGTADDVTARWSGDAAGPARRLLRVVGLGGPPVVLTLGLHGSAVATVLDGLSGGAGATVSGAARAAVPLVLAAAAALAVDGALRRRWGAVVEPVALVALCALVTPLLAFAVYFGLWHSWRQVARMVAADAVRGRAGVPAALRGFAAQAVLPTAVSLAVLGALVVLGGAHVLVTALAAVLCVTVPHAVAVARVDASTRVLPQCATG
ncbi:Brp/Blh family beta-carotene 15,15'-dioxygenase [Quadrisphaera sp. KR29]|uniref:Brp/Blh family beta-carotene 15,15'-dioxygenase n=1 Tax=Quadrisphaera sp. KR29 TaxID=3461391 RepID=UPI004044430C